MHSFFRFLIAVGVLLASTTLAPAALADDPPGAPAGAPAATPTTDPSTDPTTDPATGPAETTTPDAGTSGSGTDGSGTGPTADPAAEPATVTPVQPVTTLVETPPAASRTSTATFAFKADRPGVTFQCSITGPGRSGTFYGCPATGGTDTTTEGAKTFSNLRAGAYRFSVRATETVGDLSAVGDPTAPYEWRYDNCSTQGELCRVVAPDNYAVPGGARFNNPLGTKARRRANLNHVIRTINSMPGYRAPRPSVCPTDPALVPGTIRIVLYSVTDVPFAYAVRHAYQRCISVQILMNFHLSAKNTKSIRLMQEKLGSAVFATRNGHRVVRRSFAHRCFYGCRGRLLHTKFYLFDARLRMDGHHPIRDVTMVGSSNMTGNASGVQWNDLYTVRNNATLHTQYSAMFNRLRRDRPDFRLFRYTAGPYRTTFWPQSLKSSYDPEMGALQSIHCTGATGGAGVNGRTVVYINMHAWFGIRGYAFAKKVRSLYDHGCYVRVLYSFMSWSVYKRLTVGTGSRMSARRTLFSLDRDKYADVYSHFKNITVSGHVGRDTSAWVVWTGSNNLTPQGMHFDEVMMRIASRSAYTAYRNQFWFISRRKSSGLYATLLEPIGGGRAPAKAANG